MDVPGCDREVRIVPTRCIRYRALGLTILSVIA